MARIQLVFRLLGLNSTLIAAQNLCLSQSAQNDGNTFTVSLEWLLLTSLEVTNVDEAKAVGQRYLLRLRIEDWYRILKSGCKVEFLQYRKGERIERAVTINAVIAWRP